MRRAWTCVSLLLIAALVALALRGRGADGGSAAAQTRPAAVDASPRSRIATTAVESVVVPESTPPSAPTPTPDPAETDEPRTTLRVVCRGEFVPTAADLAGTCTISGPGIGGSGEYEVAVSGDGVVTCPRLPPGGYRIAIVRPRLRGDGEFLVGCVGDDPDGTRSVDTWFEELQEPVPFRLALRFDDPGITWRNASVWLSAVASATSLILEGEGLEFSCTAPGQGDYDVTHVQLDGTWMPVRPQRIRVTRDALVTLRVPPLDAAAIVVCEFESSAPIAGAEIRPDGATDGGVTTDPQGIAVLPRKRREEWWRVHARGYETRQFQVAGAWTGTYRVALQPAGTLRVQVLGLEPFPNAAVVVYSPPTPGFPLRYLGRREFVVGSDGECAAMELPVGTYRVEVLRDYGPWWPDVCASADVDVSAGGEHRLALEVAAERRGPRVPLRGRIELSATRAFLLSGFDTAWSVEWNGLEDATRGVHLSQTLSDATRAALRDGGEAWADLSLGKSALPAGGYVLTVRSGWNGEPLWHLVVDVREEALPLTLRMPPTRELRLRLQRTPGEGAVTDAEYGFTARAVLPGNVRLPLYAVTRRTGPGEGTVVLPEGPLEITAWVRGVPCVTSDLAPAVRSATWTLERRANVRVRLRGERRFIDRVRPVIDLLPTSGPRAGEESDWETSDRRFGAWSDADGVATFASVPPGRYKARARSAGGFGAARSFPAREVTVDVTGADDVEVDVEIGAPR